MGKAQIFIYDAYPGGIGIAEKGFELIEELWQATLRAISEWPAPTKDTTSYVRVKDSLASGAGGW